MGAFSKRLGDRLRLLRGEATLREFAPTLGLDAQGLHRIERGEQNVTLETLETICQRLKCKAGDLIDAGEPTTAFLTQKSPTDNVSSRSRKKGPG